MRHLVLYKLAGFFPTDWQPCSGGLCPQKRGHFCAKLCTKWSKMHAFSPKNALFCTFLQGGGATFWQGKNGGFSGPGGRAGAARAEGFFAREKSLLNASPIETE